jgi:predicted ATPase/tRNA A-37 threonylcarbamoyl transferase component Bud32
MTFDLIEPLRDALRDRYIIERELARGGVAAVYLATDKRHKRRVALKVLDSSIAGAVGAERFLREIEIAARLTHPHIVPLFDSGATRASGEDEAEVLYFVMPFIAGESLRARMERGEAFQLSEVVRIVREVSSALDYAHRQGVVHRDIKPENVLLSEGHAVVADFGIARAVVEAATSSTITQVGMVVGTPAYMSPEQALGGSTIDARTDQYSLACVVYEMLSGRAPFSGASAMALLAQHVTAPPPPLRCAVPVPDAVERAIHRALAKEPADRFPTVVAFADALAAEAIEPAVAAVRMPAGAPAQRAARVPVPLTPLLGRQHEVRTVLALLQRAAVRLLTLSGPGGVGKTRLALEVAAHASPLFPDGVYFVSLTEARDADALNARIAQVVGLRGGAAGSTDALRDQLRDRRALLVLDNFEQLVDAAPEISGLLADCPDVKALVTSQVVLHVYGEHELPVEPLPVPEAHFASRPDVALESPAIRLFVDRAQAGRPDFTLDESNAAAVIEICAALDGVPLAIELAAARIKTMPADALLARLRKSLDILTGGARDLPARQRTMRAAISWCHDLLTDEERMVFRRLAVFAGGAQPSDAASVCGKGMDSIDAEDALVSLANHSLIRQQTDARGEPRYVMLRPIHAFATEAVSAAGELDETSDRHAALFRSIALAADSHVSAGDETWLDRLDVERDNLRTAFERLVACGATTDALRMAVALWRFWEARSYAREGLDAIRRLLATPLADAPFRLRLAALYAGGVLADACNDFETGRHLFEQHLELTKQIGDPRAMSVASNNLAVLLMRQGDVDGAIPLFAQAVAAIVESGDARAAAIGEVNLGNAERSRRHFDAARTHYENALRVFTDAGDSTNQAWSLSHLGTLERDQGDRAAARERYRESLRVFSDLKNRRGMASVLIDLGQMAAEDGKLLEARALLEESLTHVAEVGDQRGMVRVFEVLAGVLAKGGLNERAIRLAGAVAGLRDRLGAPMSDGERDQLEASILPAVEKLGESAAESAWRKGLDMTMEDVLRYVATPDV